VLRSVRKNIELRKWIGRSNTKRKESDEKEWKEEETVLRKNEKE
jgi:hypothetical protein